MLVSKLYLIVCLVPVFGKVNQSNSPAKRKSAFINLSNVQCQCVNESFCKFEQYRLKAVRRNEAQLFININFDFYRKYRVYNAFPFNVTLDGCRFLENTHKYPIIHNIYQLLVNRSNINHTCPYYEKNLVPQNFTATYTPFFAFVPSGSCMVKSR